MYRQMIESGSAKAADCLGCGKCEEICPQHLEIRKQLELSARLFEH